MVKKEPNYPLAVLYAWTMGFLLVFTVHIAKGRLSLLNIDATQSTLKSTFEGDSIDKAFIGWGVLALILFSGAAFRTTAPLAAAFAWLIFVSVLLMNADTLLKIAGYYNDTGLLSRNSGSPYINASASGGGGGGGRVLYT